jgi:8-oxo-dGTP pyrophosphatase MutT (NUDIX family)
MERARLITLRRPPQIVTVEGRFVPQLVSLNAVDEAWAQVRGELPYAHDGPMLHVAGTSRNGHGGVVIHCVESSYRFHAVRRKGVETGLRPLGVKGICTAPDGRVLMSQRSAATLNYPGEWEFSPGGTLEPGVAPEHMLLRELQEETGWRPRSQPVARALIYDPTVRSWEIVLTLAVEAPKVPVENWECSELRLVELDAWPEPLSAVATQLLPLVRSAARAN